MIGFSTDKNIWLTILSFLANDFPSDYEKNIRVSVECSSLSFHFSRLSNEKFIYYNLVS
jgi:hypothetical protein